MCGVKITYFRKISSLNYIYYNELPLDDEDNFTINIAEKNAVDSIKFTAGKKYLLCMCRLNQKKEDDTKNRMSMMK